MIASVLQCEYIKHGMTCGLGGEGVYYVVALLAFITICTLCVIGAVGSRR
jgi:hypothetical protein